MPARKAKLTALLRTNEDGLVELLAPQVGRVRHVIDIGQTVVPEQAFAILDILGEQFSLLVPDDVFGRVVSEPPSQQGTAVGYKDVLLRVDPRSSHAESSTAKQAGVAATGSQNVFRTPMGGRYYAKPAPDADPFVKPGDALKKGATVAIIEVMKTFNRVQWTGDDGVRVLRVVPKDGDDLNAKDVLLELAGE